MLGIFGFVGNLSQWFFVNIPSIILIPDNNNNYVANATSCSGQLNSTATNGDKHYKIVEEDFIQGTKAEIEDYLIRIQT